MGVSPSNTNYSSMAPPGALNEYKLSGFPSPGEKKTEWRS